MKKLIYKIYYKLYHYSELIRIGLIRFHIMALYHKQIQLDKSVYFGKYFSIKIEFEKALLTIQKNVHFRQNCSILIFQNGTVDIGEDVFFNSGCSITCLGSIQIGNHTLFGQDVKIYDHNHRYYDKGKKIVDQGYSIDPVQIGEHCWIGSNVVILKGVNIGKHSVIGAGCIIHKDIPAYSRVTVDTEKYRIESSEDSDKR